MNTVTIDLDREPSRTHVLARQKGYEVLASSHSVVLRDGAAFELHHVHQEGVLQPQLRAIVTHTGWVCVFDLFALEPGLQLAITSRAIDTSVAAVVAHHLREHVYRGTDLSRRMGRYSVAIWPQPGAAGSVQDAVPMPMPSLGALQSPTTVKAPTE